MSQIKILLKLEKIRFLTKQKLYNEAFVECEKLLNELPERKYEILRIRASTFARSGNYAGALQDYKTIIEDGEGTISDYYLAASRSLYAEQFAKAIMYFLEVLRLGEEQDDAWFKSATYFYLSYTQMELSNYREANDYLDEAVKQSPDIALPIPKVCGMLSHFELRKEIHRREMN